MKTHLLFLALAGLTAGLDFKPILDYCSKPQEYTRELPTKLALPENYKISGSLSDLTKLSTVLLKETATKEFRVLERQQTSIREMWVEDLQTQATTVKHVNVTAGTCDTDGPKPDIFISFPNIVGNHSSINSVVNGFLRYVSSVKGFLEEKTVTLIGGVDPNTWVTCINGTNGTPSYLLEVRYGGDDSMGPAITGFSNPILYSIRIAELVNLNATISKNHWYLELDRYENPVGNEAYIEHGIVCKNESGKPMYQLMDPVIDYAATLSFFDYQEGVTDVVDILYSKSRNIFAVSGAAFPKIFKLDDHLDSYNGTDYVLQDFKYGYEITMSRGACRPLQPLRDNLPDALNVSNALELNPLPQIFFPSIMCWSFQNETDLSGRSLSSYRCPDTQGNDITEVHLTEKNRLHSVNVFDMYTRKLRSSMTVTEIPIESSKLNMKAAQFSDCYDGGHYANTTWTVSIKDKNFTDINRVGLDQLNDAVRNSIVKNVHAVIPYRIVVFYVESHDGGLSMILRLAEKSEIAPGNVTGYDYNAELPSAELFKLMNAAMLAEKMPIEVETFGGAKEEWIADAKTMKSFDNEGGFLGYTGGAMFVLAIFCLLIGVSIGAVGVFVVTRRQRISTLAYQVFE